MAETAVSQAAGETKAGGGGRVWFGEPKSRWKTVTWVVFTLMVCLYFALSYNVQMDFLDLGAYTQGLEKTPYQYRALTMYVFHFLINLPVTMALARHAEHMHVPDQFKRPEQLAQILVAMVSLFVAVLATAGTLKKLTGDRIFSRWMSMLLIFVSYFNLIHIWGLTYTLPYDMPSLMFFCLGIYLVVTRQDWVYYVVFPFGVLNRETICFLTVFFLVWKWQEMKARDGELTRRDALTLAGHGLAQAAIWVAVKLWLAHRFAANQYDYGAHPTHPPVIGRVMINIHMLLTPQQWPVYLSVFGFLLPVLWVQRRWIGNQGIYWGCAILFPLWFAGMFLMGLMPEIRIFSELSALLVPAVGLIVYHRFAPVASAYTT